jgi:hypothetical protein
MNETQEADYRDHKNDPRWEAYEEYFISAEEGRSGPQPLSFTQWLRWS